METVHSPKIDCADVIDNGILIYFEDGETAFYSAYHPSRHTVSSRQDRSPEHQ